MQVMRKIAIYLFVAVIFTGSVGINVFAHFCKINGVNYSYVIPPNHSCKPQPVKEDNCCHKPVAAEKHETEFKKNCCEQEVKSFKISSDLIQKSAPELSTYYLPTKVVSDFVFAVAEQESASYTPFYETRPPPKTGQEILILNQVFRI